MYCSPAWRKGDTNKDKHTEFITYFHIIQNIISIVKYYINIFRNILTTTRENNKQI